MIQTLKRPVPLEHFLYTGQDGKTKNDIFKIFADGNFLRTGFLIKLMIIEICSYDEANKAKNKKAEAIAKKMGGPMRRPGQTSANHPWQLNKNVNIKNIYKSLICRTKTSISV